MLLLQDVSPLSPAIKSITRIKSQHFSSREKPDLLKEKRLYPKGTVEPSLHVLSVARRINTKINGGGARTYGRDHQYWYALLRI